LLFRLETDVSARAAVERKSDTATPIKKNIFIFCLSRQVHPRLDLSLQKPTQLRPKINFEQGPFDILCVLLRLKR
jgi:hypothetical protein